MRRLALVLLASLTFLPSLAARAQDLSVAQTRAAFHALLDRPMVAARPTSKVEVQDGRRVETGEFSSEANERVPFLAVWPERGERRRPCVIVLHGTGGSKEGMRPLINEIADRGYLAVAIDARFHGSRITGGAQGATEYNRAIVAAYRETNTARQSHPFYFDTVYDLWRLVDYLQTRQDVDPKRIGMLGISMGGIQTWLAAATDERIAVSAPLIGVQSFRWSLDSGKWQARANTIGEAHKQVAALLGEPEVNAKVCRVLWGKIIPGILDRFDCPAMLRCIAPRPLIVLNGENDPNCPIQGAQIAFEAARKAYASAGAPDRLKIDVAAGVAHAVTPEHRRMALDWLDRWLKPAPSAQVKDRSCTVIDF